MTSGRVAKLMVVVTGGRAVLKVVVVITLLTVIDKDDG